MSTTFSAILKITLGAAILGLAYWLFTIIMEPINFKAMKNERYTEVKQRLENIRDAQKAYRSEYQRFTGSFDTLIAFVDTGRQAIVERKDSSYMEYSEVYRKKMEKDTIIESILGYESVKEKHFSKNFDPSQMRYVPFSDKQEIEMEAGKIEVNDVVVPVFVAKASNKKIFHGELDTYERYIDMDYALQVGSLTEPSLSGNWK